MTKNENEFQHPKHHCFGGTYVEEVGDRETLSPGRDSLHDQNGDFKLQGGKSVELGLVPMLNQRSRGRQLHGPPPAGGGGSGGGGGGGFEVARYASDAMRTSGFTGYSNKIGEFFRHHVFGGGGGGGAGMAKTIMMLAVFVVVMVFAMVGVCVCLFRDETLARDVALLLR